MIVDRDAITAGVTRLLKVNMGLQPGEHVQIVNDYLTGDQWNRPYEVVDECLTRSALARAVFDVVARQFPENKVVYYTYPSPGRHGAELEPEVARQLRAVPVTLAISNASISHTVAREEACAAGCRIASMPGFTPEMLMPGGPMDVDYLLIGQDTERLAALLTKASVVRVQTATGTDLTISVHGRTGRADTGLYDKPGRWGNLPAGEAYVAPVEGQSEGRLVVEVGWYPGLDNPMIIEFEKGNVVRITGGGDVGDYYRSLLGLGTDEHLSRRNMAELGIGTNPAAKSVASLLEAEKIKGTIHVGLGDSTHMGGNNPSDFHTDFVVPKPTVYFDGDKIIDAGRWLI